MLEPCAGEGTFVRALQAAGASLATTGWGGGVEGEATASDGATRVRDQALPSDVPARVDWCEITRGRDFFGWRERVDWIVTNPPWSQFRAFLQHAMTLAEHVVFLVTIDHLWTRARIRDIATAGFGLGEILLVDTSASFPPTGFQLGAVHLARGWNGPITLAKLGSGAADGRGETAGAERG